MTEIGQPSLKDVQRAVAEYPVIVHLKIYSYAQVITLVKDNKSLVPVVFPFKDTFQRDFKNTK